MAWRVGERVPINVYQGDRPVCQCQTSVDAARIVIAMNRLEQSTAMTPPVESYADQQLKSAWAQIERLLDLAHRNNLEIERLRKALERIADPNAHDARIPGVSWRVNEGEKITMERPYKVYEQAPEWPPIPPRLIAEFATEAEAYGYVNCTPNGSLGQCFVVNGGNAAYAH